MKTLSPEGRRERARDGMRRFRAENPGRVRQIAAKWSAQHANDVLSRETLAVRIDNQSTPEPTSGCYLWLGCLIGGGYAATRVGARLRRVSRLILEDRLGRLLAREEFACHKCDTPSCVNAAHIFLGDNSENQLDSVQKGRQRNRRKTHCPEGHSLKDAKVLANGWRECLPCRRRRQKARRVLASTIGITSEKLVVQ